MPHVPEDRKDLMLGFLYPAVLGTVLYATIGSVLAPALVGLQASRQLITDTYLLEKGTLLVATFFFYLCDYFYVRFTRIYRWSFFIYSCVFLLGLFVTLAAIQTTRDAPPNTRVVVLMYLAFIVLYFLWDFEERVHDEDGIERSFYRAVLTWEILSFILLLSALRFAGGSQGPAVLAAFLTLIILAFTLIVVWKRKLYYDER